MKVRGNLQVPRRLDKDVRAELSIESKPASLASIMATLALASLTKGEFVGRALCMFCNGGEGDDEEREEDNDLFFSF
jgi:hypothetical protein